MSHEDDIVCPFCSWTMNTQNSASTDKYIRCDNDECNVSYIPRDPIIRKRLYEIANDEIYREISCVKCQLEYIPECVLHNDKFSVCPSCNFENPYNEKTRNEIKLHFFGTLDNITYYPKCDDCGLFYQNTNYRVIESTYFSNKERNLCCYCVEAGGRNQYCEIVERDNFGNALCSEGKSFYLPPVESYPRIVLDHDELHNFSLLYLPVCHVDDS